MTCGSKLMYLKLVYFSKIVAAAQKTVFHGGVALLLIKLSHEKFSLLDTADFLLAPPDTRMKLLTGMAPFDFPKSRGPDGQRGLGEL